MFTFTGIPSEIEKLLRAGFMRAVSLGEESQERALRPLRRTKTKPRLRVAAFDTR